MSSELSSRLPSSWKSLYYSYLFGKQSSDWDQRFLFRLEGWRLSEPLLSALKEVLPCFPFFFLGFGHGMDPQVSCAEVSYSYLDPIRDFNEIAAARSWAAEIFSRPFSPQGEALLRIRLATVGEQLCVLALNFSHLIIDGASIAAFFSALSARVNGGAICRQDQQVLARSLALLHAKISEEAAQEASLSFRDARHFWRERLEHIAESFSPRPVAGVTGGRVLLADRNALWQSLQVLAARFSLSGFWILAAAYAQVLARKIDVSTLLLRFPSGWYPRDIRPVGGYFVELKIIIFEGAAGASLATLIGQIPEQLALYKQNPGLHLSALSDKISRLDRLGYPRLVVSSSCFASEQLKINECAIEALPVAKEVVTDSLRLIVDWSGDNKHFACEFTNDFISNQECIVLLGEIEHIVFNEISNGNSKP